MGKYIDSKFQIAAPRGVTSHNVRDLRLVHPDGKEWARNTTPQTIRARAKFRGETRYFGNDAARGWTSEVQLEAMDIEGIDVAVLYPTRGLRALVTKTWRPTSPPRWRAPTTIGSMIFAKKIRAV